ncbi:protein translocase subunit SecD [Amycolatopsis magusensis]|uniref:protein translocase subunit SecD n=1 Tax=Amycolatopsis magusensis TaxID=882444 RepID=UPI0037908761
MAPPAGQIRLGRYLAFFVLIVIGLYSLVFFTGNGKPTPKLGIELQGGTRVTLTARTLDGGEPPKEALEQAKTIIETRVNGIGVAGTEVVLDGNNVVITVPGEQGDQAKSLGQTAKLGFRKVATVQPNTPTPPQQQPGTQPPASQPPAGGPPSEAPAAGQPSAPPAGGSAPGAAPAQDQPAPPAPGSPEAEAQAIQAAKAVRQNPALVAADPADQAAVAAAQQLQQETLAQFQCTPNDPLRGNDDPALPLVACLKDGSQKFVLEPEFLPGTMIDTASSGYDSQRGGYVVDLSFKADGTKAWGDFTSANVNEQAAFVLDTQVVSAPNITVPILDGRTQITGGFTQSEAKNLADVLKYGSLPLSFASSDATTVSATLGLASLQAGLIAGGIGLLLVFVYCLFYYRLLGVLTILSLGLSGVIVYGVLVLLGRWINFSLDLAGVAGFIIAIGVTADSFVVFFERLKDEMREGRSFRSAVPRGWIRGRRTILASDAVMFLAAAVLYLLAVGEVRGFAFTLGMSTVLDLVVVFLVTHPLVAMVSKSKTLSNPKISGLGGVQRVGSQRRTAKVAGATVKEA